MVWLSLNSRVANENIRADSHKETEQMERGKKAVALVLIQTTVCLSLPLKTTLEV